MALLHDEIPIAMVWNNKYNRGFKDRDKLVFGEIFTMILQGKPFIMSNATLGKRLGCSGKSISRSVHKLIKNGWITTRMVLIKNRNGKNRTARQVNGVNVERCVKFSEATHKNVKLRGLDNTVQGGVDNTVQGGVDNTVQESMDSTVHQIDQSNTSNNSKRENAQAIAFLNYFQKLFATAPDLKTQQAFHRFVANYAPDRIYKAIRITKKNCRNGNPRAITSYINGCLKYPMKPKKSKSGKPKYHSRGDHDDSKYNHKAVF